MSRFVRLLVMIPLVLAASACFAGPRERAADEWRRTYPLAPGGRLEIVNVDGAIDAEPATGAAVEIVAERTAKAATAAGARELLDEIEMVEEVSAQGVRVVVKRPARLDGDAGVRFSVRVPKGVAVDLRTENGAVSVTGLDAAVHAATVNGSVRGEALATAAVEAESVNGAVHVALASPLDPRGRVTLESVNGRVALVLPAASRATIAAEVQNGSVAAEGAGFAFRKKSRTALDASLNGGGAAVRLETVNGSARVDARS